MLRAVMRRSSAMQLEHDGPGGATIGAATTTCPHAAVYRPWPAASPAVVARSLTRWSRPSTAQVIVVDREVFLRRICSTVGIAAFHDRGNLRLLRQVVSPGRFHLLVGTQDRASLHRHTAG